jgi:hypothetical protein
MHRTNRPAVDSRGADGREENSVVTVIAADTGAFADLDVEDGDAAVLPGHGEPYRSLSRRI